MYTCEIDPQESEIHLKENRLIFLGIWGCS